MVMRAGLLGLLVLGTAAVNLQALRGSKGCHDGPKPEHMADSEIVDGPDCGNVKVVVAKYGKSTAVGKLGGETRNAISGAERAAAAANEADEKATKAAEAARGVGGKKAEGAAEDAEKAAEGAGNAAADAETAAEKAEDALSEMKGTVNDKPYE